MTELNINELKNILRNGTAIVKFTKKDGTERVMKCTLNLSKVPTEKHPKGTGYYDNTKTIRVFDLEKEDWRSFRIDSIKEYSKAE